MTVAKDFTFSQSSMQSYLNCHFQFYLRYVRHLDWPSALLDPWNPAEIERQSGIRFHQLVHNHFLGVPKALLDKHAKQDANPKMAEWWANFKNSDLLESEDIAYPEISIYATVAGFNFSAKLDLLLLSENSIHIFDWKTSKRPPTSDWLRKRVQTQLYPLIAKTAWQKEYSGIESPEVLFTYWEASYPDKPVQFTFGQAELQLAQEFISSTSSEITSRPLNSFDRTTRLQRCAYCLFRTYCQRPASNSYNSEMEHELLFSDQDLVEKPEEK